MPICPECERTLLPEQTLGACDCGWEGHIPALPSQDESTLRALVRRMVREELAQAQPAAAKSVPEGESLPKQSRLQAAAGYRAFGTGKN